MTLLVGVYIPVGHDVSTWVYEYPSWKGDLRLQPVPKDITVEKMYPAGGAENREVLRLYFVGSRVGMECVKWTRVPWA